AGCQARRPGRAGLRDLPPLALAPDGERRPRLHLGLARARRHPDQEPARRQRPDRRRRVGWRAAQRVAHLRAQRGRRLRGALRSPATPGRQAGRHDRLQRHPGRSRGPVRRPDLRQDAPGTHGNPNPRAKITRMTPPADDRHDDLYDETPPRSIFAATWFRALLVLIVIGVIGAVAVPYILDAMNPPAKPSVASRSTSTPTAPPAAVTPSPSAPASPSTSALATPSGRAPGTTAQPDRGAAAGWWGQVGASRDESTAKKVAAKLREQNYKVEEPVRGVRESAARSAAVDKSAPAASAPNPAGADLYDVFVSGLSAAELNTRLSAKGLAAEPSGSGAVIKPSLPLRDAVALSKDLAVEGFKVQVRRAAGTAAAPQPAPAPPATGEM